MPRTNASVSATTPCTCGTHRFVIHNTNHPPNIVSQKKQKQKHPHYQRIGVLHFAAVDVRVADLGVAAVKVEQSAQSTRAFALAGVRSRRVYVRRVRAHRAAQRLHVGSIPVNDELLLLLLLLFTNR
jgi:hypothetical protein